MIANQAVEFFPEAFQQRQLALLKDVGRQIATPIQHSAKGATTERFRAANRRHMAPLSCLGMYRVGEDGRLRLITKSEHYHVPLGHGFPGWRLVDHARQLGICSATHNNTRGHITRLLEERLIAAASGAASADESNAVASAADDPNAINRVLNLETGSIALEAAIKLVLAQFYRCQPDSPTPPYAGQTPVLLVIGDEQGDVIANYHGTTIFAQMMRGLWPEFRQAFNAQGLARCAPCGRTISMTWNGCS